MARELPDDIADPRQELAALVATAATSRDLLEALAALRAAYTLTPQVARFLATEARRDGAAWKDIAEAYGWNQDASARELVYGKSDERVAAVRKKASEQRKPAPSAKLPGVGVAEASRRLGVPRHRIYTLVANGELDAVEASLPNRPKVLRIVSKLPE